MAIKAPQWSSDFCNERHNVISWTITTLFALLGIIIIVVGMAATWASDASTKADQANKSIEVQAVKIENVQNNVNELKTDFRKVGDKIDRMNENLQQLLPSKNNGK